MDLGTRIKLWRESRGLSQRSFADVVKVVSRKTGKKKSVSPAAVSLWESGRTEPTHDSLAAIADALGITVARFYGDVPKSKRAAA